MNIYYTAKDVEEMAEKGIQQIEVGPGVTLTDYARETAQQFNIALVNSARQSSPAAQPAPPSSSPRASSKYNKPRGCQHGPSSIPAARPQAAVPSSQPAAGADSNTVNRLIDLMGKVIKRGE